MQIKMDRLQSFGMFLSVIWFICFLNYFLDYGMKDVKRSLKQERNSCDSLLRASNDVAISLERKEDRTAKQAENRAEWKRCRDNVRERSHILRGHSFGRLLLLYAADLGTIVFGWLFVWLGIVVGRWIKRRVA
jgi:hypothetical protein